MKRIRRLPMVLTACGLLLASLVAAGSTLLSKVSPVYAATTFPDSYFAPYDYVTLDPSLQSVVQSTGQKYYTLAFITGNGCNAAWAGTVPLDQTDTFLPHLDSDISFIRAQGGDIIIAFGGGAGQELARTCSSVSSLQAQYQAVVTKYSVSHLDFDIEGGGEKDAALYTRRNAALKALQAANPGLTISFTLPSATTGLLSGSLGMLNNAVSQGVNFSIVNLMTMNYAYPDDNMGQEAINAANGLFSELRAIFPSKTTDQIWSMVGITPMIGQNNSSGEIFSLSNAQEVLTFAQQNHVGELSFWSVSRDNGNCPGLATARGICSGIAQSTYEFLNAWKSFTGGTVTNPTPTTTPTGEVTPTSTSITGGDNLASNPGQELL